MIFRIVASSFSDFIAFLAATNRLTSAWQRSKAVRASASSAGLPSAFAFSNLAIAALERVKSCPAVSMFSQPPRVDPVAYILPGLPTGAMHYRIARWFVVGL